MSRELFLGTIVACVAVVGIVLYRLPRDEVSRDSIQYFRGHRGFGLFIGLALIGLGLAQLYAGFRSGQMELPLRHAPGRGFGISYNNHAVIFGILGVFYSILAMSGLALVKMMFEPEIRTAPLFRSRLTGLGLLAIAALVIFGLAS